MGLLEGHCVQECPSESSETNRKDFRFNWVYTFTELQFNCLSKAVKGAVKEHSHWAVTVLNFNVQKDCRTRSLVMNISSFNPQRE